ncbi:MAG: diguanylate cyclase domain-containing protein [Planctomycetota bacterium]
MPEFQSVRFSDYGQGLFSPAEMEERMRTEFDRAQRYKYPLVCALIAVDRLGQLQDLYGHESKDEILRAVVGVLKAQSRESDLLGVLPADRLMAIFPHTAPETAGILAKRFLAGSKKLRFERDGRSLCISLSVGLAHNKHPETSSFETLMRVAEEGLAVAEAGGGDRFIETELYQLFERRRRARPADAEPERTVFQGPIQLPSPAAPIPATGPSEPDRALSKSVIAMLAAQGLSEDFLSELDDETIAQAIRRYHETHDQLPAPPPESDATREQVDILERRIAKLTQLLGTTEDELRRVAAMKGIDLGMASIYKNVQGLADDASHKDLKKVLMREIFEANFELMKRRHSGDTPVDKP